MLSSFREAPLGGFPERPGITVVWPPFDDQRKSRIPLSRWLRRLPGVAAGVAPGLLLAACAFAAYANGLDAAFHLDDGHAIVENRAIRSLGDPAALLDSSRPLVELSFAVNYAANEWVLGDGLAPSGLRVGNVAVHALAAWLLFLLVRRTAGRRLRPRRSRTRAEAAAPEGAGEGASREAVAIALTCALIWLLHPLQTQAVTYLVQRAEAMAALFCLLALYATARLIDDPARRGAWIGLVLLACAAGMASKATAITAPVLLLLYDHCFDDRPWRERWRQQWPLYAALGVLFVGLAGYGAARALGGGAVAGFGTEAVSWIAYARTQPAVILHYLRLGFWPDALVFDYHWDPYAWPADAGKILGSAAVVLVLIAASAYGLLRRRFWGFCGAGFFLYLAPTSSVVPIQDLAVEHRLYLPLAVPVVLVVAGAGELLAGARRRWPGRARRAWAIGGAAALVLIAALGARTVDRNRDYRSSAALWRTVIERVEGNPRAHHNLGVALAERGRLRAARRAFREALRIWPGYPAAHEHLGVAHLRAGRPERALARLRRARALAPGEPSVYRHSATALRRLGRWDEAEKALRRARELAPASGKVALQLGALYARRGSPERAERLLRRAVARLPRSADARSNLGHLLSRRGEIAEARRLLREAVAIDPAHADAWNNLGVARARAGRFRAARNAFRRAVDARPEHAGAWNNLGRIAMRAGEPARAASHFHAAIEKGMDRPAVWRRRIAALERAGKPAAARAAARAAAERHPENASLERVRERLAGRGPKDAAETRPAP